MLALDGFHDTVKPIAGYPDRDTGNTVTQVFSYVKTIVCPEPIRVAGGKWDCAIFTLPLLFGPKLPSDLGKLRTPYDEYGTCYPSVAGGAVLDSPFPSGYIPAACRPGTINFVSVPTGTPIVPNKDELDLVETSPRWGGVGWHLRDPANGYTTPVSRDGYTWESIDRKSVV